MTFLHPLLLLGLAFAAIPALLHLFERRHPPEASFPALRYLSEAERESARRLKLRHLLLLLLRTALLVLVVLAAARPLVPVRLGGTHEPTALAVILDNSPSSGVVVDGRPLFEHLRAVARASLSLTTEADRTWLVLADGVMRRGSKTALLAALDSAIVSARRLDLSAAVDQAVRVVSAEPLGAREVHVVSDVQQTALGATRVQVPAGVRVLVLAPPSTLPQNRGIGDIVVSNTAITVAVVGTPHAGPGAVTVRVGARTLGRALAAPGAAVTVPLASPAAGWWTGEVALDADELRGDDRRAFVGRAAPPARVRVIGDPGVFVRAGLGVLREAGRATTGDEVAIGERPGPGPSVVYPPADRALLGETNRALAARGVSSRFGAPGTPGPLVAGGSLAALTLSSAVARRYRIEAGTGGEHERDVLATVNGEPWLVRDSQVVLVGSRFDTAWTALPASTAFLPLLDALLNRVARGEAPVARAEGPVHVEFHTRGRDTVGATVFGPDPRESDLTPAPQDLVERMLGARYQDERRFMAARFTGSRRAEVSGWLLVLALLVAAVEFGVATVIR